MKCVECQALIEEYFDGELDQLAARSVSVHVETCLSCAAALQQLAREHQTYQSYDRDLEVSPALWLNTRAQITAETRYQKLPLFSRFSFEFGKLLTLRFSLAASVALVLFAVLVTVIVMKQLNKPEAPRQVALLPQPPVSEKRVAEETTISEPVKKEVPRNSEGTEIKKVLAAPKELMASRSSVIRRAGNEPQSPGQLVREAEKKYLSAIALLTRDAHQRQSQIDPATRVKLDGALASIDRTILSTRKAVQQNPNDPLAVQYMLAAYGKKVDVLKEMSSYQ